MSELAIIPALLAVAAAWDIGRRWVRASSDAAIGSLRSELREHKKDIASALAAYEQRCVVAEQVAIGVKNRLAAAEAAAAKSKPRGWSHGGAVKIG